MEGRHVQDDMTAAQETETVLQLAPGVTLVLVRVPAGEFLMGSSDNDKDAIVDEKPQHRVYLTEYLIGQYPVTVAQFAAFVWATGYEWDEGIDVKTMANHPVTEVSWDDAVAFCQWARQVSSRTVRLPTEAEWEKAARGTDGRLYPWGSQAPDGKRCNFNDEVEDITPVGKYSPAGDSPYGCADMAGNVYDWCDGWFGTKHAARPLRGGSRGSSQWNVRCAGRWGDSPGYRNTSYGFRICAFPR